jgi:hypothetical protein
MSCIVVKRQLAVATLLALALPAVAQEVRPLGRPGDWARTSAGAVLDGQLYTVEESGVLYATDIGSAAWRQIGGRDFVGTDLVFAAGGSLYTIERSGTLYSVNPRDGRWAQVGRPGDWRGTVAGAVLGDQLYTVERSGVLYVTDPRRGTWKQLGRPEFRDTRQVHASGGKLVLLDGQGNLAVVDPADGSRLSLGSPGGWRGATAGAIAGGRLYTVDAGGALSVTDLSSGERRPAGRAFAGTRHLFAAGDALLAIDGSGNLGRVALAPAGPRSGIAATSAPATAQAAPAAPATSGTFKATPAAFVGRWVGDLDATKADPAFAKQTAGAPKEILDMTLNLLGSMSMVVTAETVVMSAMGEASPPERYKVVSSSGSDLVIEDVEGEKKGTRITISFADARHFRMMEAGKENKAAYFRKE